MGDTKPSNNTLHKAKRTRGSILSYGIGLHPVLQIILEVRLKEPAASLTRSCLIHNTSQEGAPNETLV